MSESRKHPPSPEQQAFYDWVDGGRGSAVLEAVAGAGKTTTLVEAVHRMRGDVFFGAYNSKIAKEIKGRLGNIPGKKAGTFHSAGFSALCYAVPALKERRDDAVDDRKVRTIARGLMQGTPDEHVEGLVPAVCQLVSLAKQTGFYVRGLVESVRPEYWEELAHRHDVLDRLPDGYSPGRMYEYSRQALRLSNQQHDLVDYDDMCYLPLLLNTRFYRNDWVLVDECFLSDTPVLTGLDGSYMTIGEMVETKYTGPVMSWHPDRGTVVSRATGGKRVLRNKRMVQIRYLKKQDGLALSTRKMRFGMPIVVCTEDHKIWTADGWTSADKLSVGQTVLMETAQGRVRDYQQRHMISAVGKNSLSGHLAGNDRGLGNTAKSREDLLAVKGGNGTGLSRCERIFAEKMFAVGVDLESNVVIPTRIGRGRGYPTHYKVDFAVAGTAILVEIDGQSHRELCRREQDERKDALLAEMGFSVTRITNRQVEVLTPNELLNLVQPGCLVEAEILDVREYTTKEQYVYDIEVEDTHCYFAHGLLVHNCQDTNAVRREMCVRMLKPGGRLVAVGDPHQAIYGFTGADNRSMDLIRERFGTTTLRLSVSWRCPQAVVARAQDYVSHIHAAPSAPMGVVRHESYTEMLEGAAPGNAILCRFNAPLVELCFRLIRMGRAAKIEGRDIGEGIVALVTRWKVKTLDALENRLTTWLERETAKIVGKKDEEAKLERLRDRYDTMRVLVERGREQGRRTVAELADMIREMFADRVGDQPNLIVLCSVHRSKGLEWPVVRILGLGEIMPSPRPMQDWQMEQERNLCYVAITRAQDTLVEVRMPVPGELDAYNKKKAEEAMRRAAAKTEVA